MPTTNSGFLIQSTYGRSRNFELVLADCTYRRLAHCWRENDDPGLAWIGPHFFGSGNVRGPSLIQSNFGTPDLGNLEVVVRESNSLAHYWRSDQPPFTWHGPLRFAERQVSGNPAFIQSRLGYRGNFEVVAPRGGKSEDGLVHYCRNNDHADLPWIGPTVFATSLGHAPYGAIRQKLPDVLAVAPLAAQTPRPKYIPAPPVQPIPYSHKQHLALGLECKTCHEMPEPGDFAGLPSTAKCMSCHDTVKKDSPSIRKLAE